jgi:hypothetical protein
MLLRELLPVAAPNRLDLATLASPYGKTQRRIHQARGR